MTTDGSGRRQLISVLYPTIDFAVFLVVVFAASVAWRRAPRRDPLRALRRVVERPDPADDASGHRTTGGGQVGSVRIAAPQTPSAVRPSPLFDGVEAAIAAGGSPPPAVAEPTKSRRPGRGRSWSGIPSGRRRPGQLVSRRPASQPEPSHRDPARSPQTLITTTPGEDSGLPLIPPLTLEPAPDPKEG